MHAWASPAFSARVFRITANQADRLWLGQHRSRISHTSDRKPVNAAILCAPGTTLAQRQRDEL